jgi:hypothetical protein
MQSFDVALLPVTPKAAAIHSQFNLHCSSLSHMAISHRSFPIAEELEPKLMTQEQKGGDPS